VILIAPLHLLMGSMAGAGTKLLVSWYLLMGFGWFLLSSAAVLFVLLGGVQAIAIIAAVACPVLPLWMINTLLSETIYRATWFRTINHLDWFGLPINTSPSRVYVFGITICLIASYWVWQALERRYLNPTCTVISKSQSYLLNLCLQLGIAGFTIPLLFKSSGSYYFNQDIIAVCVIIEAVALLLFIPMLLPSKQAIQDWSRYRRERTYLRRKFWQREDLVRDLLTNDKSPAILAIAANLGIAIIFWLPAVIFAIVYPRYTQMDQLNYGPGMKILVGICLLVSLLLTYTAIAHVGLFLKVRNQKLWIFAGITGLMTLPVVGAYLLSPNSLPANSLGSILLLFSPLAPMISLKLSMGTSLATFAAQLGIFAILTRQLQQKLQISGRSLTKELTANY
jgi:hypothetical protein